MPDRNIEAVLDTGCAAGYVRGTTSIREDMGCVDSTQAKLRRNRLYPGLCDSTAVKRGQRDTSAQ